MDIKDEAPVEERPSFFAGTPLRPERQPGESFEAYRARRALEKRALKIHQRWGGREAVARHIEKQKQRQAQATA